MSEWIQIPHPPMVHTAWWPVLVETGRVEDFLAFMADAGAACVSVDVAHAASGFDIVQA